MHSGLWPHGQCQTKKRSRFIPKWLTILPQFPAWPAVACDSSAAVGATWCEFVMRLPALGFLFFSRWLFFYISSALFWAVFFFFWNVAALCCWPFFGRRLTPACISRFSGVQSPGAQVCVCVRSAVCELSCFFTLFHLFISVFSEVESSAIKNTILLAVTVWLERIFISSQVVCCDCPRRHDVYGFMSNLRPSNPNAF